ncbi:arginase [Amaricoccus solimangrovi]|uniref:Arginase n=2 Tax=Amaricoccus solimangrovi TaxID=2589815 RepID=A0A501WR72_9RHOB|nr:arginase [Amaricoccus solimangrovi]
MLGIGLELGASTRGALMGPDALRTAGIAPMLANLGHRFADRGTLREAEPVRVDMAPEWAARCNHLAEIGGWTRAIHDRAHAMSKGAGGPGAPVPLFVGGDHAISMGTISGVARACAEAGREIAVLWVDAHPDYNTPETTPSGNMHGMSLAFLAGDPILAPLLDGSRPLAPVARENIHVIGARSIDPGERARLRAHGIDCVDMRHIDERGVCALMEERIARWKERGVHLHLSLDLDSLDPSVAPGTGTQVPGGATYREAHLIMEMLSDSGLVGSMDLVELNPFLDERGRSAVVAVELIASVFGRTVLDRLPDARRFADLPARA